VRALSRNCSHHSSIFVVEDYGLAIYKSSSLPRGVNDLKNEILGYTWYNNFREDKIRVNVELETSHYIKIKIQYIDAIVPVISKGYLENAVYIELAIKHYVSIWGGLSCDLKNHPIHGDYSIEGNILFKGEEVFIIDWEHFSDHGGRLGFDAIYLLFETLWLDGTSNSKALNHVAKMIELLKVNDCIDLFFLNSPLESVISFMRDNQHIWGEQFQKMPILRYTKNNIEKIDSYINQRLSL